MDWTTTTTATNTTIALLMTEICLLLCLQHPLNSSNIHSQASISGQHVCNSKR